MPDPALGSSPTPGTPPPATPPVVAESKQTVGEWLDTKDFEKAPWLRRWFWFAAGVPLLFLIILVIVALSSGSQSSPPYTSYSAPYSPTMAQGAM